MLLSAVTATQARLYFNYNNTGIENCDSGTYTASYTLTGDQLKISFVFNGQSASETRTIILTENNQLLSISLPRSEASRYINDDSGTATSSIGNVEMKYRKVN
ncbi:hypothetical protein LZ575_19110 [Antarcticibacterium sp. 1MA-6-2]|uniref:hypothetical protein n=1 Tax=Antarcticibacterium sp. 1MA-6-2 TaxID=2908210 RepID=UPI001F397D2C|nr:hypothetical protein [Antarcticibacterium sp. 1MA-6-2]UJH90821.1 hypothetical protein LZ575_19110 [Antarcticibacterium sp. 1MA-6-2]